MPSCNGVDTAKDTRERRLTRGRMDVGRKADDGSSSGFLFSSTVGVATRQVVLCLNWCASPGKPESTTSNARTKPVTSSTGKRSAVKVACCVWAGGKSASSYLSLPLRSCLAERHNRARFEFSGGVRQRYQNATEPRVVVFSG